MPDESGADADDASVIRMGDIFIVNWNPGRGSEQMGERPALIVQNNAFNANANYPNTIVVTISKSGRDLPVHVRLPQTSENGLWEPISYVKCEQLLTISKSRLVRKVGSVSPAQLSDVSRALKRLLSLV